MTTDLLPSPNRLGDLVTRLQDGELDCWDELIARFQPLVDSMTRRYRLCSADASDVSQTVWLRLFTHIRQLREPRALPGWIVTTTSRACMDALNVQHKALPLDPQGGRDGGLACAELDRVWTSTQVESRPETVVVEARTRADSRRALREAMTELTTLQRDLLLLLMSDPPLSYQQISDRLGIPIGSIGPTRARALAKLRQSAALRAPRVLDVAA